MLLVLLASPATASMAAATPASSASSASADRGYESRRLLVRRLRLLSAAAFEAATGAGGLVAQDVEYGRAAVGAACCDGSARCRREWCTTRRGETG